MNKNGEIGIGILLSLAIGIIVALVMLQASAVGVGQSTTTQDMNKTYTAPAVNVTIDLQGQELITVPFVTWNHTCSNLTTTVGAGNYTIAEGLSTVDGLKRIRLTVKDPVVLSECGSLAAKTWRISYTFGPEGYIDDAGGRSIAGIILLLAAVGIAMYALSGVRWDF